MTSVPSDVRNEIIKRLYLDADALDWERLSVVQKAAHYQRWVDNPDIGGRLTAYHHQPHLWIKEGPMKEYARALEGMGKYPQFSNRRYAAPEVFVPRVLGDKWSVVHGSVKEKPAHCIAVADSSRRYVCWGGPATFKDLLWAALSDGLTHDSQPAIVVCLRSEADIEPGLRAQHRSIARRCGMEVGHVIRPLVTLGGA
jgi:hypothetical protein